MWNSNFLNFYIHWISILYNYINISYINVHKGKIYFAVTKINLIDNLQVQQNDFWAMKMAWVTSCIELCHTAILLEWPHQYFRTGAPAQNSSLPRRRMTCSTQPNCHMKLWEVTERTLETIWVDCSVMWWSVRQSRDLNELGLNILPSQGLKFSSSA